MIKLECNTWEELENLARKVLGIKPAADASQITRVVRPAILEPVTTPLAPIPDPVPTPAPAPAPAPVKTVTRQDVQAKAIQLMDAGKQDQLQQLLTKYGVPALPSVPDDKLAAFMADLEAM